MPSNTQPSDGGALALVVITDRLNEEPNYHSPIARVVEVTCSKVPEIVDEIEWKLAQTPGETRPIKVGVALTEKNKKEYDLLSLRDFLCLVHIDTSRGIVNVIDLSEEFYGIQHFIAHALIRSYRPMFDCNVNLL